MVVFKINNDENGLGIQQSKQPSGMSSLEFAMLGTKRMNKIKGSDLVEFF